MTGADGRFQRAGGSFSGGIFQVVNRQVAQMDRKAMLGFCVVTVGPCVCDLHRSEGA